MDAMEQFLQAYPAVAWMIISLLSLGLLTVVLAYAKKIVENNTSAIEELSEVMKDVVRQVHSHDVTLGKHEVRIEKLEERR